MLKVIESCKIQDVYAHLCMLKHNCIICKGSCEKIMKMTVQRLFKEIMVFMYSISRSADLYLRTEIILELRYIFLDIDLVVHK